MSLSPREEAVLAALEESLRADEPAPRHSEPAGTVLGRLAVSAVLLLVVTATLPVLGQADLAVMLVFVALPWLGLHLLDWAERTTS